MKILDMIHNPINDKSSLDHVMISSLSDAKPLPEPMMIRFSDATWHH